MQFSQLTITEKNTSPLAFIEWMREQRLLPSRPTCSSCFLPMRVQTRSRLVLDGACLRCPKCKRVRSIRTGSWFSSHSKISLVQCVRLGVSYNSNASIQSTATQWNLNVDTVSNVFAGWRDIVCRHVDEVILPARRPFSGSPVEVDCATFKHLMDTDQNVWIDVLHVQGILEPFTDTFRYKIVTDQKATSLRPHILKLVPTGTVIMTDEHKSYQTLPADGYHHYRVNHNQRDYAHQDRDPLGHRFIVTTNHLESLWAGVRRRLRNPKARTLQRLTQALKETVFVVAKGDVWSLFREPVIAARTFC